MDEEEETSSCGSARTTLQLDLDQCDEAAIDFICERLNSKNDTLICETVLQIKNLIIGNNKYKTIYLKEKLIKCLIELINNYYTSFLNSTIQAKINNNNNIEQFIEPINQILIIFGSFSLGNLEHVSKLIRIHNLHNLLFTMISKLNLNTQNSCLNRNILKIIESSLRCLSNLYSTSQMVHSLIGILNKYLYTSNNYEVLLKLFPLSTTTKQVVLNIFTLSLGVIITARPPGGARSKNYRDILLKSDIIKKFSCLLTSLNQQTQLNILKFYSYLCFEDSEASLNFLSTSYYDYSLLDLISAYLSRENNSELQLYAAKCLTNLCRSTSFISSNSESNLVSFHSNLIKHKTLPTLIRLCCTYSYNYRNKSSITRNDYFQSVSLCLQPSNNAQSNASNDYYNQSRQINTFLLIESVSTLAYLIELDSDLQTTAGYLEQIIPTLTTNVLISFNSVSSSNMEDSSQLAYTIKAQPVVINESKKKKRRRTNLQQRLLKQRRKLEESCELNTTSSERSSQSYSLYSIFYLSYIKFSIRGIHFRLKEHQYKLLPGKSDMAKIVDKSNKFIKNLDKNIQKRVSCVCFQALACLASNNEDLRRSISENTNLISRLVESVQLDHSSQSQSMYLSFIESATNVDIDMEEANEESEDLDLDESDLNEEDDEEDEEIGEDDDNEHYEFEDEDERLDESDEDDEENDASLLRLSSLCLIHSLSKSVHQLRTKFLDNKVALSMIELIKRIRLRKKRQLDLYKKNRFNLKRMKLTSSINDVKLVNISNKINDQNKQHRLLKTNISSSSLNEEDEDELQQMISENDCENKVILNTSENKREEMMDLERKSDKSVKESMSNDEFLYGYLHSMDGNINEQSLLSLLLATLANLVLEFSPCKETLINNDIIKILVEFIDYKNISIKTNSMWALMNLAYQVDQKTKLQIISEITIDKLFQLLTENDETLIIKTLNLIRNLISNRPHIDHIMTIYGTKIIQAIVMILEGEYYSGAIKEQALYILANVADGSSSKEFIMGNEDLLRKISSFMTNNSIELQIASVVCVTNLVWNTEEGVLERQLKLKEIGTHRILQKLLSSNDSVLFEKAKNALQQFSTSSMSNLTSTVNAFLQQHHQSSSSNSPPSSSSSSSSSS